MSTSNQISQFLQAVSQNEQLQQELMAALETAENDREAAAEIAKKYGYELSADEIGNEVARIQAEFLTISSALSEEELESVAGGWAGKALAGVATGVSVAYEGRKILKKSGKW